MSILHTTRFVAAFALAVLAPLAASAASVNLPAGTEIFGHIRQDLSTKTAYNAEKFTIVTDGGSVINGHLSEVYKASPAKKAHMKLNYDSIRFSDGTVAPISATTSELHSGKKINILQAAGTVVAGDIVGNILGKKLGTNAGGLLGIAGGALYAANTAVDITVPANSRVGIKLTDPLIVRPQAR